MATHQITVSNDMTLIAGGKAVEWGDVNWNAFLWGGDAELTTNVAKLISNSQASASALLKKSMSKLTGSSVTTSSGPSSERLMDGNGWYHTFISNTDEGEDRDFAEWTNVTDDGETWVEVTVSTTWS